MCESVAPAAPEFPVDGLTGGQQTHSQNQEVKRKDWSLGQSQEEVLSRFLESILAQEEVGHKVTEDKETNTT